MIIFSTILLASPFLIQEPGLDIPFTLSGEEAKAAFLEWTSGLPSDMEYPAQMSIEMSMGIDVLDGLDQSIQIDLRMNSLSDSPESLRTWGEFSLQGDIGGGLDWTIDFQVGTDENGLRILIDDRGSLMDSFGIHTPKAMQLSADRLGKVSALYLQLFESMPTVYGEEMLQMFRSIEGPGALMHPSLWSRYLIQTEGWKIDGWGAEDGLAHIRLALDPAAMTKAMEAQGLEMDSSIFEGTFTDIVVSLEGGEILYWEMEMEMPMNLGAGQNSGEMALRMEMKSVPVSANAPLILLPFEGTMDLNPHFDTYFPMMESIMLMAAEQAKSAQGEIESEDDFDF